MVPQFAYIIWIGSIAIILYNNNNNNDDDDDDDDNNNNNNNNNKLFRFHVQSTMLLLPNYTIKRENVFYKNIKH